MLTGAGSGVTDGVSKDAGADRPFGQKIACGKNAVGAN
jgi:hypothetical protein